MMERIRRRILLSTADTATKILLSTADSTVACSSAIDGGFDGKDDGFDGKDDGFDGKDDGFDVVDTACLLHKDLRKAQLMQGAHGLSDKYCEERDPTLAVSYTLYVNELDGDLWVRERPEQVEFDNAATTVMNHSPDALDHMQFKDIVVKVANVDHTRVVNILRKAGHLLLVKPYVVAVQSNVSAVNEALNEIYVEESFDQIGLALKIEIVKYLEMRHVADRWKQSIPLSKKDDLYKELLEYFLEQGKKECFTSCLFVCYDLIRPDVALELAWMNQMTDYALPYKAVQRFQKLFDQTRYKETECLSSSGDHFKYIQSAAFFGQIKELERVTIKRGMLFNTVGRVLSSSSQGSPAGPHASILTPNVTSSPTGPSGSTSYPNPQGGNAPQAIPEVSKWDPSVINPCDVVGSIHTMQLLYGKGLIRCSDMERFDVVEKPDFHNENWMDLEKYCMFVHFIGHLDVQDRRNDPYPKENFKKEVINKITGINIAMPDKLKTQSGRRAFEWDDKSRFMDEDAEDHHEKTVVPLREDFNKSLYYALKGKKVASHKVIEDGLKLPIRTILKEDKNHTLYLRAVNLHIGRDINGKWRVVDYYKLGRTKADMAQCIVKDRKDRPHVRSFLTRFSL